MYPGLYLIGYGIVKIFLNYHFLKFEWGTSGSGNSNENNKKSVAEKYIISNFPATDILHSIGRKARISKWFWCSVPYHI